MLNLWWIAVVAVWSVVTVWVARRLWMLSRADRKQAEEIRRLR